MSKVLKIVMSLLLMSLILAIVFFCFIRIKPNMYSNKKELELQEITNNREILMPILEDRLYGNISRQKFEEVLKKRIPDISIEENYEDSVVYKSKNIDVCFRNHDSKGDWDKNFPIHKTENKLTIKLSKINSEEYLLIPYEILYNLLKNE